MRPITSVFRVSSGTGSFALGVILVLLMTVGGTAADSEVACQVEQLSFTSETQVGARALAFSQDGRTALILTYAIAGPLPIPTKPELFTLDVESKEWSQLTNTPDGTFLANMEFTADAALQNVVFVSDQDLAGENPGRVPQLFLLNTSDEQLRQLTAFAGDSRVSFPRLSGDGSTLVFTASANPLGLNRDGSRELFLIDTANRELQQVTRLSQAAVPSDPSLNFDGSQLVFLVTHSLSGFSELDLFTRNSQELTPLYTASHLAHPLLVPDAKSVFFVTDIDPAGENPDRRLQIFRLRIAGADGQPLVADQLSRFPQAQSNSFDNLAVSGDGRRLVFRSELDLLDWQGEGADNLYLYDPEADQLNQLTHLRAFNEPPTPLFVNEKGSRVLFSSQANLTGRNGDGNFETFLASCKSLEVFYFPQIGEGVAGEIRFRTSFVLANTGPDSQVQIDFFSAQGEPLFLNLGDQGHVEGLELNLARGTPMILESQGNQPLQVGFARVRSTQKISASAVFTESLAASNTTLYEASVPMTRPLSEFSVVVNTRGSYQTGLAMVNPPAGRNGFSAGEVSSRDAELLLRLYDDEYNQLAEKTLILPSGRRLAQFVAELFPEVPGVREMVGLLTVRSTRPVAVVTLRLKDDPNRGFPADVPTLTTLDVAPGIPEGVTPASQNKSKP